jgi:hypothetical protein
MPTYISNRFLIGAGAVSGTVQNFVFTLPTANTPTYANATRYPSFLVVAGTTGATTTDTATLTLADGYAMPLVASTTMAAATVMDIPVGTVLEITARVISGVLTGVILNR